MKGGFRPHVYRQRRARSAGFTVVETLIVLAVTGALFVAAAYAISGRQNATQFTQAIQDVQAQLRQTIGEVQSGFYPNNNDFNCIKTGTGPLLSTGISANQGENKDCLFLGKVIQFAIHSTDPEEYNIYSVAGLRLDSTNQPVTSLASSKPRLIARGSSDAPSVPDEFSKHKLLYGLTVQAMYYNGDKTQPIGALGFVSDLNNNAAQGDGSQQVNLLAIRGTSRNDTKDNGVKTINTNLIASATPPDSVQICFMSGGTKQSGLITIGSNGRQLSVDLAIKSSVDCT